MTNSKILSVSEVNKYVKTLLESNSLLRNLAIQGELSNVRRAASGHLYFSLKDAASKIDCVMFKNAAVGLNFLPKEGQKVTIRGSFGVYLPYGQYQITVRSMEPQGVGDLFQAYLVLKDKLENQGYFDHDHKQKLPEIISRVGLVTSPTGAAIKDVISIIKRRNPLIDMVIYPSPVQGDEAVPAIIKGIRYFNQTQSVDVIIIGRGGGAIEDLWAFNDERLAKVIYDSQLPIISAVGHEIDYTIADFVADLRAPTPSGAAELVAEETLGMIEAVMVQKKRLIQLIETKVLKKRAELEQMRRSLRRFRPRERLDDKRIQLDAIQDRMMLAMKNQIKNERLQLKNVQTRITAMDPAKVQKKGYVRVTDAAGLLVDSITGLKIDQLVTLHFVDGEVAANIQSIKEN